MKPITVGPKCKRRFWGSYQAHKTNSLFQDRRSKTRQKSYQANKEQAKVKKSTQTGEAHEAIRGGTGESVDIKVTSGVGHKRPRPS